MKNPKENGLRWLEQAGHDLEAAKKNLEVLEFYSDACFMAEQASQKALKAFLLFKGERYVLVHSVNELVRQAVLYDQDFENLAKSGSILDQYYIPTRYPDALASPAIPYKSFTRKQAEEAVKIAKKILCLVRDKITRRG
jgi:HEPN domain-containing protein